MDVVTITLSRKEIVVEEADYTSDLAAHCLTAFATELSARLNLTFDLKHSGHPERAQMKPPFGTFIIARLNNRALGCVGVKGSGGPYAEIKRMWIDPAARGLGLARSMMQAAEEAARALGICTLRLDTNSTLFEAVSLYRSMGWREIERFNSDPYPDLFFEKHL